MFEVIIPILLGALLGFSLGFFGSGGSSLAVPALVYGLGLAPKEAIASSLIIVASAALIGLIQKIRAKQVAYRVALIFILAGVPGSYVGTLIAAQISGELQMILFGSLLLVSASSLLFNQNHKYHEGIQQNQSQSRLGFGVAFGIGILTGLLGVGGGFMIVPALVVLMGLGIHKAMGTSLLIIVVNAFAGAFGYLGQVSFNVPLILYFVIGAGVASYLGALLCQRVEPGRTKKLFAIFILVLGVCVLLRPFVS